ncbi:carbonic anhydrase [Rhizobium leguminosarum]|uniref:carbonic anhydrase n=1 Tax=Rhizobium leguminosarum TaxID=384 RepID=UPI000FEC4C3A|nr:carbonic anhydrase [Rhizobium leguminosarum]RWX36906.1 carbonic anhydrase [Rhizobium leguminosarum]
MTKYSEFEFRTQPWFDQSWFDQANFQGFSQFIPMKTIVIHCIDPRASEIPKAVADHFGDEVYPGENILDEAGNRVGHTQTLFAVSNAGGRALAALQSVATMDYLFKVQKVAVVHRSFCGATAFTPELLIGDFHEHHHADISTLFDHDSLAITDFEKSIRHDVELLRASPAVPKNVKLYGFFYEINSGALTEVARDIPASAATLA